MDGGKLRDKLTKLFGMLGSKNAGESENARQKINELLERNRKTWNDLTELLRDPAKAESWHDPGEEAS